MKAKLTSILRALAVSSAALWFAGCETEAEDAAATNVVPTVTAVSSTTNAVTNAAAAAATTNAAVLATNETAGAAASGTNAVASVTNNQTVIVNKVEPTVPTGLKLSKGVEEVIKLAQSGVSETVMLLFVEKSEHPFDLDAAEIVYLNDIGIPQTVIASMLNHDGAPQELKDALATNQVEVAEAPAAPVNSSATAAALPAQPVQVTTNYVPDPNYQAPVVQQPVVVQQEPVVVQQPVVIQQPVIVQPAVTHSYFYSSLAPYGSWVEVADYGWCWQPTIAVTHRGWRPYLHGGRWLHSDHGWYWHSDYSWGWAPFHYGRWHVAGRHGWVWVPDYTWGPSWVTWRYSGNYCGWAPLPPRCHVRPGFGFSYWGHDVGFSFSFGYSHEHYSFVPTRHFHHRRPLEHVVPTDKTVNIYKDSTVVNNYIVGNNNTIVNNGISRDRIVSHTRTEIPRVRVQEAPATGGAIQPDRLTKRGTETIVYRPKTPPAPIGATEPAGTRGSQEARRPAPETPAAASGIAAGPRTGQETRRPNIAAASAAAPQTPVSPAGRIASRPEAAPADLPKPAAPPPVRPEPAPVFTPSVRNSRAVQEARSAAPPAATTPGESISPRPSSRFGRTESARPLQPQSGRSAVVDSATPVVRPTAPPAGAGSRAASESAMPPSISGRAVTGALPGASAGSPPAASRPVTPAQNSRFGSGARSEPSAAMPPSISGQAVPGSNPSSIGARPAVPSNSRFGSSAPAMPPSISGREVPGSSVRPESRFGTPQESPRQIQTPRTVVPQQPRTAVDPGPGLGSSRFGSPSAPAVVTPRSESFSRPAVPNYQPSPPPTVQPRSMTPVERPSIRPDTTPVAPSGPAQNPRFGSPGVNIQSGSISGNSRFGSPPPAAAPPTVIHRTAPPQPSAPPQQSPQTPQGRGRIEIGR